MFFTSSRRRWAVRVAAPVTIVGALTIGVAGQAFAAGPDGFSGRIPSIGSSTFSTPYVTTPEFRDINLTMTDNPFNLEVKAVRCYGGNVSGYKPVPADNHKEQRIAVNVKDGTCFKLNFAAATVKAFDVAGLLRY